MIRAGKAPLAVVEGHPAASDFSMGIEMIKHQLILFFLTFNISVTTIVFLLNNLQCPGSQFVLIILLER